LFKKGDRAAAGVGQQKHVSIPRTNHRINRKRTFLTGRQSAPVPVLWPDAIRRQ